MTRIRVDPRKVQTVEMKDGTRYPVGRNGWVDISAGRHEAEIRLNPAGRHDVAETGFLAPGLGFVETRGRSCVCGFGAWPWQDLCPRCGMAL